MAAELDREGKGVAVLGHFVPSLFHPVWFADNDLIREDEAERADVKIVSPEFALWQLTWLQVQVIPERLDVVCTDALMFEPTRDIAAGAVRAAPGSRPRAVGINHYFHYAVSGMPASLNTFFGVRSNSAWSQVEDPALTTVTVRGSRPDGVETPDGHLQVEIAPSIAVKNGVYLAINDHYDIARSAKSEARDDEVQRVLFDLWDASYARGRELANTLASEIDGQSANA